MSHNVMKVGAASGDRESEYTANTAALNQRLSVGATGANEADYDTSPASAIDGSVLYFYDPAPANGIAGASVTSSSNWISSVTLPPGTYLIVATFSATFSASGRLAFQLYDGAASFGTRAQIGDALQFATEPAIAVACGVKAFTVATTVSVVATSSSTNLNSLAAQGTTPSRESSLLVRRL